MENLSKYFPFPLIKMNDQKEVDFLNELGAIFYDGLIDDDKIGFLILAKKCLVNKLKIQRDFRSGAQDYKTTFIFAEKDVIIFTQEITELIKAKEEAIQSEKNLRNVIDAIPGFVSWVNKDLYYQGVNAKLAQAFDSVPDDFVGKSIGFLNGQSEPSVRSIVEEFVNSPLLETQVKMKISCPNGKTISHLLSIQSDEKKENIVLIGVDIKNIK
jgi:PAS domain-containing protein